ncbi:unnamed protein product [Pieris macdunnoughi]|uniref:Uncharacterized protein n=1 Tax=Pieris macdunnoughi TaxID=345717 RepID=A0A821XCJ7_9NEOP|nr:unnamed protein product [Pieris macdunnoughi]
MKLRVHKHNVLDIDNIEVIQDWKFRRGCHHEAEHPHHHRNPSRLARRVLGPSRRPRPRAPARAARSVVARRHQRGRGQPASRRPIHRRRSRQDTKVLFTKIFSAAGRLWDYHFTNYVILGMVDDELLQVLAEDPSRSNTPGKDIQSDLAVRRQHIATSGLSKDTRKELLSKYLLPGKCTLINAPDLNAEVKAAISDTVYKRDQARNKLRKSKNKNNGKNNLNWRAPLPNHRQKGASRMKEPARKPRPENYYRQSSRPAAPAAADSAARELREKERLKYLKKKEKGQVKSAIHMNARELRQKRKQLKENSKVYRNKKAIAHQNLQRILDYTPPSSPVSVQQLRENLAARNRRQMRRRRAVLYAKIAYLEKD